MTDLEESIFGVPSEPASRRKRFGRQRNERRQRGVGIVALVVLLVIIVGGLGVAGYKIWPYIHNATASKDFEGPGHDDVQVTIKEGDSGGDIAQHLVDAGVIKTAEIFTSTLLTSKGAELQPGSYSLHKEMSAAAALSMMRKEGPTSTGITVPEGRWKSEIYALLSKNTGRPVSEYEAAEKAAEADPSVLGLPAVTKGNPEGWLFPKTYPFTKDMSAKDQLKSMVQQTKNELTQLGISDDKAQQTLTIASLVEAESRNEVDRPKVARVFDNRLEQGWKLQLDSTVSYAAQNRSITTTDEERASASPYNTYYHEGLPPGPIDSPGVASIKAAGAPADGPWMFFVAVDPDTGETRFAVTAEEHEQNVLLFQQWCSNNPGKC